jgi:hypothetical protein
VTQSVGREVAEARGFEEPRQGMGDRGAVESIAMAGAVAPRAEEDRLVWAAPRRGRQGFAQGCHGVGADGHGPDVGLGHADPDEAALEEQIALVEPASLAEADPGAEQEPDRRWAAKASARAESIE